MRRALDLAERGRGHVEPNPLVGAVVVRDGQCIGEGWHRRFGDAHAEVEAIRAAGDCRGATLYVTLEPCCHHGKTPPCTDAILRAGLGRVIAALEDPFPQVAGRGAKILREAGVPIEFGVGAAEARRQNAPYRTLLGLGRPHVHGKWAMTLDGKIATVAGASKWISGAESRLVVHELRGRMDGILVGIGAALADDPALTARPPGPRTPCRVVLDRLARLPLTSQLVRTARETPTLVFVGADAPPGRCDRLRDAGVEIASFADVPEILAEFGRRRWTNLLVEGGGRVTASFVAADALDEVHVFIASKIVGGSSAPTPVEGPGIAHLADARTFAHMEIRALGGDAYLHGWRGT
ncbi:MAG TPA: bifunctional diaminohydroxyphosphoribosylaminopyrimidine deaminase/5-amino-6-(5-phosphoribosylamino)uracil reductase RibD [Gemmataceae bacterium]|nr:bifunctional diaminohydroxyphosphoribosylaminopyrimidine deaminase/5-amino-6-(5-phosphoribosylamino)uracil reductase RibD [Gemmataceae bacterium]